MLLTSPVIVVATILPTDNLLDSPADDVICPVNSNPCLKLPLIFDSICAAPLIVLSKSVLVKLAAEPDNDVATILPNDAVIMFSLSGEKSPIVPVNSKPLLKAPLI